MPLASPNEEAMSDRPSRRSPPASSRSTAAARSSDWMVRAIGHLPPVHTYTVRQCRTVSAMPTWRYQSCVSVCHGR